MIALVVVAMTIAAFWYVRTAREQAATNLPSGTNSLALSDSSRSVLNHLNSPVEIRFYSMLDRATVPASLFAYVDRVNRMLLEFELAGNGRISVTRYNSLSDAAANAAASDGFSPFNLDKGNACYLGLAVACGDERELLSDLSPQWESALEFDLSRAIEHVTRSKSPANPTAGKSQTDEAAIAEVRRAIPDTTSVSVEDGTRILREAALKEFGAAAKQAEVQVKEAQQRLSQVQNSGSEAEQQAAMKLVQQLQLDQAEKLKQIAARLQAQITAFNQLKGQ
jgi:hypothetical protein